MHHWLQNTLTPIARPSTWLHTTLVYRVSVYWLKMVRMSTVFAWVVRLYMRLLPQIIYQDASCYSQKVMCINLMCFVVLQKRPVNNPVKNFWLPPPSVVMACLPSRKNLANESLRNCDVRQVFCILTIFCHFKPKNICIFPKFSSFQLFQSEMILVKCCKEVIVPLE